MYSVHLINFGYTCHVYESLEEAKTKAESTGFECAIRKDGETIICYSPLRGFCKNL